MDISTGTTLRSVVQRVMAMGEDGATDTVGLSGGVAVFLNGDLVSEIEWERLLCEADEVVVVPAVRGGL